MTEDYIVVYEWTGENYSAYLPDLPGCVACGDTIEETEELMREAIRLYIEALAEEGSPVPAPTTQARPLSVSLKT